MKNKKERKEKEKESPSITLVKYVGSILVPKE